MKDIKKIKTKLIRLVKLVLVVKIYGLETNLCNHLSLDQRILHFLVKITSKEALNRHKNQILYDSYLRVYLVSIILCIILKINIKDYCLALSTTYMI